MLKFLWSWALYTWGGLHRYFGIANTMPSEYERAIHYFSRAYEVDPTFTAARLQRGVLLSRELGRHEEALADFDAILAELPNEPAALLNRGLALQAHGRFHEALVDLEAYLSLPQQEQHFEETQRLVQTLRALTQELDEND